jgi:hypothetical protein
MLAESSNHVSSILAKLGVCDRARAVLRALEAGLLHPRGSASRGDDREEHARAIGVGT